LTIIADYPAFHFTKLEMAQQAFPDLNIKTEPAYILFDKKGVVHQSKELGELATFLGKNIPK
jgi:hypothetical protein